MEREKDITHRLHIKLSTRDSVDRTRQNPVHQGLLLPYCTLHPSTGCAGARVLVDNHSENRTRWGKGRKLEDERLAWLYRNFRISFLQTSASNRTDSSVYLHYTRASKTVGSTYWRAKNNEPTVSQHTRHGGLPTQVELIAWISLRLYARALYSGGFTTLRTSIANTVNTQSLCV